MITELLLFKKTFIKKSLLKADLDRYMKTNLIQVLYSSLCDYRQQKLFDFEVRLSLDYIAQEDALEQLKLKSIITPIGPRWVYQQNSHGLVGLYENIKTGNALSEKEIIKIIEKLPSDLSERYLQFKLINVDWDRLKAYINSQLISKNIKRYDKFSDSKYKNLTISGTKISYKGRPFFLRNGHMQALRILLNNGKSISTYDEFLEDSSGVFKHKNLKKPERTLVKLISELRKELYSIIGYDCIVNDYENGWHLELN